MARSAASRQARSAQRVSLALGPFVGQRDRRPSSAPGAADEAAYLHAMTNAWVRDPANPSGVELRPPWRKQDATPGARTAQGIFEHVSTGGTTRLFQVAGGKLYRYDSPGGWTDVSPAATISSAARYVYLTNFNNKLVVSDGVNKPWAGTNLGSTPITSTVINVDTAASSWAASGAPVVYGGKLVFIRDNDRTRIVWSEELDEATGYEQSSYSNFWALTQTDARPLTALAATNDALYFFRSGSVGAVYGAIAADFSTTATRDAISTTIGTTAPASVKVIGNEVWFLNQRGAPSVITPGGGVRTLAADVTEALYGLGTAAAPPLQSTAWTAYHQTYDLVLMAVPTALATDLSVMLVFHAASKVAQGAWRLPANVATRAAGSYSATGTAGGEALFLVGDANGVLWQSGTEYDTTAAGRDYDGSTYTPIAFAIETEPIAGNPASEVRWDRITAAMRIPSESALAAPLARSFTLKERTPRSDYGAGQAVTTTASYDGGSARAVVGVLALGRSLRVRIETAAASPGRFLLDSIAVEGTAMPPNAVST